MVHYVRRTRPSALALERRLNQLGYRGPDINWGTNYSGLNADPSLASNKRRALYAMQEAGVPVPKLYTLDNSDINYANYPLVGRPDHHRKGRQFYLCHNSVQALAARNRGATHFMEYIDNAREFRVWIVNGKSIKISEKIGGGVTKNFDSGARFYYPQDFNHKKTLRQVARQAVQTLGLDFGAVDILWKDDRFYVLEVNTAPCLTNQYSDTLERFAAAIVDNYQ